MRFINFKVGTVGFSAAWAWSLLHAATGEGRGLSRSQLASTIGCHRTVTLPKILKELDGMVATHGSLLYASKPPAHLVMACGGRNWLDAGGLAYFLVRESARCPLSDEANIVFWKIKNLKGNGYYITGRFLARSLGLSEYRVRRLVADLKDHGLVVTHNKRIELAVAAPDWWSKAKAPAEGVNFSHTPDEGPRQIHVTFTNEYGHEDAADLNADTWFGTELVASLVRRLSAGKRAEVEPELVRLMHERTVRSSDGVQECDILYRRAVDSWDRSKTNTPVFLYLKLLRDTPTGLTSGGGECDYDQAALDQIDNQTLIY